MSGMGVLGVLASPGDLFNWNANDLQAWSKHFLRLADATPMKNIPEALAIQAHEYASMHFYSSLQTAETPWYQYGSNGAYAFSLWQEQHPTEGLLYMYLPVYHTKDGGQTWHLLTTLSHFHLEAFAKVDWRDNDSAARLLPTFKDGLLPSQISSCYPTEKGFLQLRPRINAEGLVIDVNLLNQQAEVHFTSRIRSEHLKSNPHLFIYA